MLPVHLSFAKLDIVLGRVRETVGGKLMFNQDSDSQCPVPSWVAWVGGVLKGWCLAHQTSTVMPLSQGTNMSWLSLWLLPVWLVLPICPLHVPSHRVWRRCTLKMENASNFYLDFYFKYAGLNALEFICHVSSCLFFLMASRNLKSHACSWHKTSFVTTGMIVLNKQVVLLPCLGPERVGTWHLWFS